LAENEPVHVFAGGDVQAAGILCGQLIGLMVHQKTYAYFIAGRRRSVQFLRISEKPAFHAKVSLPESFLTEHSVCRTVRRVPDSLPKIA